MSELLLGLDLGIQQREYASIINRSASMLIRILNDILDISKIQSGCLDIDKVPFPLAIILEDAINMFSHIAKRKSLDFRVDLSGIDKDLVLEGDPQRLQQILLNLLSNSVKFTSKGFVRLSAAVLKEVADTVEVKFVVEDSGVGISDAVRTKLFQPFSQGDASTARRYGGTGLGLSISKHLLDLMHGSITLDSRVGSGTIIAFRVPFQKPQVLPGNLLTPPPLDSTYAASVEVGFEAPISQGDFQANSPSLPIYNEASTSGNTGGSVETSLEPAVAGLPLVNRAEILVLVVEDK
jgi:signal transduction histidine kinase